MRRAIVSVGTGHYATGVRRLRERFAREANIIAWEDALPQGSPSHQDVPYAFKAHALDYAASAGMDMLLWCDACIVPGDRPLAYLWEKIQAEGIWFSNNGFSNYEWTADSAYRELFHDMPWGGSAPEVLKEARERNRKIPHVVATAFGIDLRKHVGRAFLEEYLRLAQTRSFCGPWINDPQMPKAGGSPRVAPCGPVDVRGHRHDQTAASVIAWRLGVELTNAPEWFAYHGGQTDRTCLVADGNY